MVREMGWRDKGRCKTHIVVYEDWKKSTSVPIVIGLISEVG